MFNYKFIGDNLSLSEFNKIVYLLRKNVKLSEGIKLSDEINGKYADYIFEFSNLLLTDKGFLLTSENLGKVILKNPVLKTADYILKLKIMKIKNYNAFDDDKYNNIEYSVIEVNLKEDEKVPIVENIVDEAIIIDFNSEITVIFDKPEIKVM